MTDQGFWSLALQLPLRLLKKNARNMQEICSLFRVYILHIYAKYAPGTLLMEAAALSHDLPLSCAEPQWQQRQPVTARAGQPATGCQCSDLNLKTSWLQVGRRGPPPAAARVTSSELQVDSTRTWTSEANLNFNYQFTALEVTLTVTVAVPVPLSTVSHSPSNHSDHSD